LSPAARTPAAAGLPRCRSPAATPARPPRVRRAPSPFAEGTSAQKAGAARAVQTEMAVAAKARAAVLPRQFQSRGVAAPPSKPSPAAWQNAAVALPIPPKFCEAVPLRGNSACHSDCRHSSACRTPACKAGVLHSQAGNAAQLAGRLCRIASAIRGTHQPVRWRRSRHSGVRRRPAMATRASTAAIMPRQVYAK